MADSQVEEEPLAEVGAGLVRPLLRFNPGLDHPPPGTGEGLRERDMGAAGVPVNEILDQPAAGQRIGFDLGDIVNVRRERDGRTR